MDDYLIPELIYMIIEYDGLCRYGEDMKEFIKIITRNEKLIKKVNKNINKFPTIILFGIPDKERYFYGTSDSYYNDLDREDRYRFYSIDEKENVNIVVHQYDYNEPIILNEIGRDIIIDMTTIQKIDKEDENKYIKIFKENIKKDEDKCYDKEELIKLLNIYEKKELNKIKNNNKENFGFYAVKPFYIIKIRNYEINKVDSTDEDFIKKCIITKNYTQNNFVSPNLSFQEKRKYPEKLYNWITVDSIHIENINTYFLDTLCEIVLLCEKYKTKKLSYINCNYHTEFYGFNIKD